MTEQWRGAAGVYCIKNINTGKRYVGSSENVHRRIRNHICLLRRKRHHNRYLQNAWNKSGGDGFVFELLEQVEDTSNLLSKEQFWMDALQVANPKNGYNLSAVAGRPKQKTHKGWTVFVKARLVWIEIGREDNHKLKLWAKLKGTKPEILVGNIVQEWLDESKAECRQQMEAIAKHQGKTLAELEAEWLKDGEEDQP